MGGPHRRWRYHRHVQLPSARAAQEAHRTWCLRAAQARRRCGDQRAVASGAAMQAREDFAVSFQINIYVFS